MKNRLAIFASFFILHSAFCIANASPLKWDCKWPEAKSQPFTMYHGETATFEPAFYINGVLNTNIAITAVYIQTNGMGSAWWQLENATFHPTNDVGAASYRFFVEARDTGSSVDGQAALGLLYRANGTLRMLDSPGFVPNTVPIPPQVLDFAAIQVENAPWPAEIASSASTTLSSALRGSAEYTDSAIDDAADTLRDEISDAADSAFNDAQQYADDAFLKRNAYSITTPGVVTDWLASGATGGPRIRASSSNTDNYTAYAYAGIAVRRLSSTDNYLYDNSDYGIARMKDIPAIPTSWPWSSITSKPTTLAGYGITDATTKSYVDGGLATVQQMAAIDASTKAASSLNSAKSYTDSAIAAIPTPILTESDPTIGLTNGTIYVHGSTITPLTSHQSLSGYVPTSRTVNSKALSSNITLSASDVGAAPSSLTSEVTRVSSRVSLLESWFVGDNLMFEVSEATTTNATFRILYTNELMYASAQEHTNTLNAAIAAAAAQDAILAAAIDAQKADKDWGKYRSGGSVSPDDTLVVEKQALAITGGGSFSTIESTGYYAFSVSLGSTWTIASLAAAQNPDNPTSLSIKDNEGNAAFTVESTASRNISCVAGVDMLESSVTVVGGNDVVTMNFPVDASQHPTLEYLPSLDYYTENDFAEATAANWPNYITSVSWSQPSNHLWQATITMDGQPGQGFFRGQYEQPGTTYTRFNKPIGFSQLTIDGTNYTVHVETINGKKLLVLE